MPSDAICDLIEDASQLITRLDTRVLASPLAEAWQVRACFLAAESLASVDGTPTRPSDILRILSSTPLPSRDGYYPAMTAVGHWRRCMARVELSELAARIVGAKPSPALQAQEEQEDRDREDRLPRAARQWSPVEILRDIDSYALRTAERALEVMRSDEPLRGSRYLALARGLQAAVRIDPDPDYFDRIHDMREQFMADAAKAAEEKLAALPSPTEETVTQMRDQQVRWLENVQWDKKPHWSACYAVLPDRMVEMGLTTARLSCLTGATKRLGFEGRLDDRAAEGFLRKLAQEARAGLDLLDDIERQATLFARSPAIKIDKRSTALTDIAYAFLLFPALDSVWLQIALGLQERVVQKFIKRLADSGLIVEWGMRKADKEDKRDARLWSAFTFSDDAKLLTRPRPWSPLPSSRPALDTRAMLDRYRDVDLKRPFAEFLASWDEQARSIDERHSHFYDDAMRAVEKRMLSQAKRHQ